MFRSSSTCVVTTYRYLDDDFISLLYILAMRQAENIIVFHRPEVDFRIILRADSVSLASRDKSELRAQGP